MVHLRWNLPPHSPFSCRRTRPSTYKSIQLSSPRSLFSFLPHASAASISTSINAAALTTSASALPSPSSLPFLFLVGGPCAGKGTQSRLLVEEFGGDVGSTADGTAVETAVLSRVRQRHPPWSRKEHRMSLVHLSIGALLRRELQVTASKWKELINTSMQSGRILPGELTVDLLALEVLRVTEEQQRVNAVLTPLFLIDGFPRSMDNVHHFTRHFGSPPLSLLLINASDTTLRLRMQRRGAQGSIRSDDTKEVLEKRIASFHTDTREVLEWWKGEQRKERGGGEGEGEGGQRGSWWLREVDGERSIEAVYEDVRQAYLDWTKELLLSGGDRKREGGEGGAT